MAPAIDCSTELGEVYFITAAKVHEALHFNSVAVGKAISVGVSVCVVDSKKLLDGEVETLLTD